MALSGEQFEIRAGDHHAVITGVGATLRRYAVAGVDVIVPFAENQLAPNGSGGVLMPWPNRLVGGSYEFAGNRYQLPIDEVGKGNAIHGLVRWARWSLVEQQESTVTMGIDIVPRTGWPFEVRAEVAYHVDESGLSVTARAENRGGQAAPFGAGFHPYISLRGHKLDEASLRIPATQRLETNDAQIPIGVGPVAGTATDLNNLDPLGGRRLDDGFTGLTGTTAQMITPSGGAEVWWDDAFAYLQVFTSEVLAGKHQAIAIEPMTCPANAFNSGDGLIVLKPGDVWQGRWGIRPVNG